MHDWRLSVRKSHFPWWLVISSHFSAGRAFKASGTKEVESSFLPPENRPKFFFLKPCSSLTCKWGKKWASPKFNLENGLSSSFLPRFYSVSSNRGCPTPPREKRELMGDCVRIMIIIRSMQQLLLFFSGNWWWCYYLLAGEKRKWGWEFPPPSHSQRVVKSLRCQGILSR